MPDDSAVAVHELRVHQIELEMQNEDLRRAQLELELQRARYFELFDLTPMGYLTLSEKLIVGDANLTAAGRLGGDELRVLLPGIDLYGACGLAQRLRATVRSSEALAQRGVTVSAGVPQWTPDEIPDDILRRGGGDAVAGGDAAAEADCADP
jgi:hypothetical protein